MFAFVITYCNVIESLSQFVLFWLLRFICGYVGYSTNAYVTHYKL